tara:strand:- start:16020 stop:16859 length:840 start_codon:yes stop_codon:yes gene_type:complete
MNRERYRRWYFRKLKNYEKTSRSIVKRHLKNTLITFAKSKPTEETIKPLLNKAVTKKALFSMLVEVYTTVGGNHGDTVLNGINNQTLVVKKRWASLFIESFAKQVLKFLGVHAPENIKTIRKTLINEVIKYIAERNDQGKSVQVITNEMVEKFGTKEGLYNWQLERIVRTETGAAANLAAFQAMDDADLVIDKIWLSADDSRTRDGDSKNEYNHAVMNGKPAIPHKTLFQVPNQNGTTQGMMHPMDMERGSASNVINCRCTTAPVPRRDKRGRLVLKPN